MATRRLAKSTVDWSAFAKRVPENQMPQFNAFKSKSDGYAIKVAGLPEVMPAIDWTVYQSRVTVPGMVADFKKQYEAMTIPYPADSFTSNIDEEEKASVSSVAAFVQQSATNVTKYKEELARVQAMLPVEEMYLDEYFEAFPNDALDPFDRPTMWPHTEDVQPEYLEQMDRDGKFDEEH